MKIHSDVLQGSDEWYKLRANIPTASEFSVLVTKKTLKATKKRPKPIDILQPSRGEGVTSFLYRKLASRWLGRPLDVVNIGFAGDQGKILEEEAIPRFELDTGLETKRVGFVTTDDGKAGCSPDAIWDTSGAEIKCPLPQTHTAYLLENKVPDEYFAQVQGTMLVTGAPSWYFMSYCRQFPPLIICVERDREYLATLSEALGLFNKRLEDAYAKLVQLNGGPPVRPVLPERDLIEEFYDNDAFKEILL